MLSYRSVRSVFRVVPKKYCSINKETEPSKVATNQELTERLDELEKKFDIVRKDFFYSNDFLKKRSTSAKNLAEPASMNLLTFVTILVVALAVALAVSNRTFSFNRFYQPSFE